MTGIIGYKEPPYADPHVRWCERSENKSRRKTYFCFPPTLFYNCHFINQVAAIAELVEDEEHVADIYGDTTLEVVIEVDVATQ